MTLLVAALVVTCGAAQPSGDEAALDVMLDPTHSSRFTQSEDLDILDDNLMLSRNDGKGFAPVTGDSPDRLQERSGNHGFFAPPRRLRPNRTRRRAFGPRPFGRGRYPGRVKRPFHYGVGRLAGASRFSGPGAASGSGFHGNYPPALNDPQRHGGHFGGYGHGHRGAVGGGRRYRTALKRPSHFGAEAAPYLAEADGFIGPGGTFRSGSYGNNPPTFKGPSHHGGEHFGGYKHGRRGGGGRYRAALKRPPYYGVQAASPPIHRVPALGHVASKHPRPHINAVAGNRVRPVPLSGHVALKHSQPHIGVAGGQPSGFRSPQSAISFPGSVIRPGGGGHHSEGPGPIHPTPISHHSSGGFHNQPPSQSAGTFSSPATPALQHSGPSPSGSESPGLFRGDVTRRQQFVQQSQKVHQEQQSISQGPVSSSAARDNSSSPSVIREASNIVIPQIVNIPSSNLGPVTMLLIRTSKDTKLYST